jgi:hypothetical protein
MERTKALNILRTMIQQKEHAARSLEGERNPERVGKLNWFKGEISALRMAVQHIEEAKIVNRRIMTKIRRLKEEVRRLNEKKE